jgi:HK97 family phage portal protein
MKIFGLSINRAKKDLLSVPISRGWFTLIREAFAGAWQQNIEVSRHDVLTYPTLYACINRIAMDIGKLPFCLKTQDSNGLWQEQSNTAYSPVLRKPNEYQTAQQFREAWIVSKLVQGNAYILKQRDQRGVVTDLYLLEPWRVQPMVTATGAVYYKLMTDPLNSLPLDYPQDRLLVPATEIIHDRCVTFHHPLVGVPPLSAAYWPVVKNLKILQSATQFFSNNSNPGGILTAPAGMSDDDAQRVRDYWQTAYSGNNAGKVAVIGADMKFTSFAMKGVDNQLVEQMSYSDQQICQPFGIPPFKIGIGELPRNLTVDALNLLYFDDALQSHVEAMENLLEEGLKIPANMGIWMDTSQLLRMDVGKQVDVESKLVSSKIKTPDEARAKFNLAPTGGGKTLWGQQQDYPLGMLADRAEWDPNMVKAPAGPPSPAPDSGTQGPNEEESRRLRAELWQLKALQATREAINA